MTPTGATYDGIIDCARSLIIAGGYNGFSYADIAGAVGIRKASIHHHFPTKADLVRILVERYRTDAAEGLAHIERNVPEPVDQLRAYIGYWADCIADPSTAFCVCALLASEIPLLPQEVAVEVRAHFEALSAWLTSVLQRGVDQGAFALKESARAEAETLMATVHGAMLSARAYGDSHIFSVITDALIERLVSA
ncbi:TetR/AcrR family transcriptional regulator [Mycolicibacterium sp.]|uniref:TetR/AcrR family transcriptional regulator n=1 Tax=Mycolicibacterium sp. TaxID=2320850 RepID=UPI0037C67E4A